MKKNKGWQRIDYTGVIWQNYFVNIHFVFLHSNGEKVININVAAIIITHLFCS